MESFSKEDIYRAYMAGYEAAQGDSEISEWDGWHRTDPRIEFLDYEKQEEKAKQYAEAAKERVEKFA